LGLLDDLQKEVKEIVSRQWTERDGTVVPTPADLKLGNDGVKLQATVLYADLVGSTELVSQRKYWFSAEVYKAYMVCAAKIIKSQSGAVTAYDGDRIMGVFIGENKEDAAIRAAMQINWALINIVNSEIKSFYVKGPYAASHAIGVDTSELFACRIGVRNDNDIVWVGRAANYAAKLSALRNGYPIYITGNTYDKLSIKCLYGGPASSHMWEERTWTAMDKLRIFRSNWWWKLY
jgi:class 3 adenylate cyclase